MRPFGSALIHRERGKPRFRNPPNDRIGFCGATTTAPAPLVANTAAPAAASGPPSTVGKMIGFTRPVISVAYEFTWPPRKNRRSPPKYALPTRVANRVGNWKPTWLPYCLLEVVKPFGNAAS